MNTDTLSRSEIIRSLNLMLASLDFSNPKKRPTFNKEELIKEQEKARRALAVVIDLLERESL